MNDYLNFLNSGAGLPRWRGGSVHARLRKDDIDLLLAGQDWKSVVGGTFTFYFLAAYNYALLKLSTRESAAYPGLSIIDLPANISDRRVLTDQENYLVEPFIALLDQAGMEGTQLIITGHAYEGLEGTHRVELNDVFEPTQDSDIETK